MCHVVHDFFLYLMKRPCRFFSIFYFRFCDADHRGLKLEVDRKADPVLEQRSEAIIFLASIIATSTSSHHFHMWGHKKIPRSPVSHPLPVLIPND
jgi:hypothetical protein